MPLPWKKAKVSTISRLVTDLHHSPNRGNSLVVQTGFPASLVDLFYKNRDRLKKPYSSSRSNKNKNRSQPSLDDDEIAVDGAESSGIDDIQEVGVQIQNKDRARKRIMRKLVPKKLRQHRKKSTAGGGDDPDQIVEKTREIEEESSRKGKTLLISDVLYNQGNSECDDCIVTERNAEEEEEEEEDDCLISSGESQFELDTNSITSGGNSGCLIVLLLAVLVGLAGGRVAALLLTVLACLMLKFAQRRKMPIKKD